MLICRTTSGNPLNILMEGVIMGLQKGCAVMDDISKRIDRIDSEIDKLPAGYICRKNIRGRMQLYYQWVEDGKKKSKYLNDKKAEELEPLIERRRELQKELKEVKAALPLPDKKHIDAGNRESLKGRTVQSSYAFRTDVLTGDRLLNYAEPVRNYRKRDGYRVLHDYLYNMSDSRVFILYGLRRTGKTTLIRQSILDMSEDQLARAAFIQVRPGMTLGDINRDLRWLASDQYKYVFLDEVTLAEDFIEGAALFSDIYAASGMKIVLSGTDSLGFVFSESEELYDRCVMLHTTFIPYREFERVLGIKGIDEYICYGGTMSLSGRHYNESSTFASKKSTDEYVDSSIARNIQHSLRLYQYGGHFRHLGELFEKDELTSAINRIVEDINHRFVVEVLTNDFVSHDLGISAKNLRKDRDHPTDILDRINKPEFTEGLRKALSIRNRTEQSVAITDAHCTEIKEYLDLLDLTSDIPTEFIPVRNERAYRTAIVQPGLRYAQAEAFVRQLLLDEAFQHVSATERALILERILNEIKGRMMEDIVLLETKAAQPSRQVFRLQYAVGEFDMVVWDPQELTCELYEIKHSSESVPQQYRFLADSAMCEAAAFRYGRITGKAVIYRGEDTSDSGIEYINVESYLKGFS